ncbi:hypothetical protein OHD33_29070 [Escherichia coli]|nr:hypothetical protein [Escherichia coli]
MSNACGMYRLVTVPDSFLASALIAKPYVLMADNIIPAPKRRHTGIAAATSSKETQESKAMKNRKAKRLFTATCACGGAGY